MVKNLSCVNCAAWNVFSVNSLPPDTTNIKQLKYPNGRLMPFDAPVSILNFNSQGVSKFSRVPYLF